MNTMTAVQRSSGGRLVSVEGKDLPLKCVAVRAEAEGGLARVVLSQIFANPYDEPLKVSYSVPLPADGAVAGYEIRIGDRVIRGEIDRRESARERFEEAILRGETAAILDQERANLFTQELGNVPPHVEVAIEVTVDQRLGWLAEGMWEWRFPTVAAPRYLGGEGRVPDADKVTMDVAGTPLSVRASLELRIGDELTGTKIPVSPSHAIVCEGSRVTLPAEGAALDRDLVVRWPAARPNPGLTLMRARPEQEKPHAAQAYGLLTIVPPSTPGEALPRDLALLIDTSGSMTGRPIDHARKVAAALVASLTDSDTLEMIAFSDRPRRWQRKPAEATARARREATAWIESLQAGGGTEMVSAVEEALRPLRSDAQRQVVLMTDGEVGFESDVVRAVRDRLPAGSRLHTVGIGSAVNRAVTRSGARAGRGVEILIGLDEDPSQGAARLVTAVRSPVVVNVEIAGSAVTDRAPRRSADLLAGAPVLASVRLSPAGGDLIVRGVTRAGAWEERVSVPPSVPGTGNPAVTVLYGREAVEDLEMDLLAGALRQNIDQEIERIGLEFGIATRLTSWVAVSEEPDVDPRLPSRRERIPQMLPYGMSAEGLGLRMPAAAAASGLAHFAAEDVPHALGVSLRPTTYSRTRGEMEAALRASRTIGPSWSRPAVPLVARGRWARIHPDGPQVIEVEFEDGPIEWNPRLQVVVFLRDGTRKEVELDQDATTMAGRMGPGMIARAGIRISPEEARGAEAIEILCPGGILRIEF